MESPLYLVAGALVLLIIGWVIFKFFFKLLKHFIMAAILAAAIGVFYYQPWNNFSPTKDPNIGKFVYGLSSSNFLGVVVGDDGENSWIVEKSGLKMKYAKGRVVLKDR